MKKIILLFILSSMQIFAQDYSKNSSKEELIEIIKSKDAEIAKLKKNSSESKSINEKSVIILKNEKDSLFSILNDVNEVFLMSILNNKYTDNFFLENDLVEEDKKEIIKKYILLISSIKATTKDQKTKELCQKASDFETNYSLLFEIKKTVFANKCKKEVVDLAIKNIETLPKLNDNSKLNNSKKYILDLLKNYAPNTCALKKSLDKFNDKSKDQKALQKNYNDLEIKFKNYPYLVKVIKEMKKDLDTYSDDLDINCEQFKESETQPIKQ